MSEMIIRSALFYQIKFDLKNNVMFAPPKYQMSRVARKPAFGVSDQVRHKPGCIAAEEGKRLEILDSQTRVTVLCSQKKN